MPASSLEARSERSAHTPPGPKSLDVSLWCLLAPSAGHCWTQVDETVASFTTRQRTYGAAGSTGQKVIVAAVDQASVHFSYFVESRRGKKKRLFLCRRERETECSGKEKKRIKKK
ncbi:hypothetical protein ElyMa_005778100 [Elysia marginata]|uniref:Sema domain-containing protein n=1 Tax=Elysia marginata TaxID=1093978 RepID=A0AAV4FQD9_9GAST|nr:hypothetical protein ElyMa_005778100 [Elysia marginata]